VGTIEQLLEVAPVEGVYASQGPISREILVSEDALDDDIELVQAVVDYVNDVQEQARLSSGEYPEEASWSYCADYYLAQVNNGGHGQYAHNSRMMPRGLRDCRLGLEAMGAHEYLAIFDAFLAIMAVGDERAQAIIDGSGFGDIDPEIESLDSRFFALSDAMTALNAAWLRSLPILKPLPRDQIGAAIEALGAANPLRDARSEASAAAQRKYESEDLTYVAAHACAAQEGATFERLTAGMPIGPDGKDGIEWGAISSAGFRWLRVIHGVVAEWRDDKRALKGIYFYETKGPYRAPVGDGKKRAEIMGRRKSSARSLPTLTDFYLLPLANLTLAASDQGASKAINALMAGAVHAKSLQILPRSAHREFSTNADHAVFRLTIAYMLWDLSIREVRLHHPAALADEYLATAVMAAAGVISATAAAVVRLPRPDQIAALAAEAPDDFRREQENVWLQLHELQEWWRRRLRKIGETASATKVSNNIFLRPSTYKFARELVFAKDDETLGAGLARQLSYFDAEYGRDPKAASTFEAAARSVYSALQAAADPGVFIAADMLNKLEQHGKALLNGQPAYVITEARAVEAKTKSPLVAVLKVLEVDGPGGSAGGVDFDARGARRTLGK
jgi:hypothetical protein